VKEHFDKYLDVLARTERLPLHELANYQQTLLRRLVQHAHDRAPFYRRRLQCLFAADGKIDLSRWNDVPILRRDDVVRDRDRLRVHDLAAEYGEIAEPWTSGSTGAPLQVATNGLLLQVASALLTRTARRFGMDTARPLAVVRLPAHVPIEPYPDGNSRTGWSSADPATPYYELDVTTPVDLLIEWLSRRSPSYLHTLPSGALGVAFAVSPAVGRALGIRTVLMYGETVPDGARAFIFERLGARAAAIYSCEEIGHIASECEAAPHYHVAAENALVEIVDDDGRDVRPGERGRVIVTGLYNYAMPFIRYELGDFALAGVASCACGRSLPVIARIEGRARNAFLFRDGTRVWPRTFMVDAMRPFVAFSRCQLVQRDFEKIEMRVIPDGSERTPDLAALTLCARRLIHPSANIEVVEVGTLGPGPGGKFEEFISEVQGSGIPHGNAARSG
jgi:phenylacetate-CoA ligase